MEFSSEVALRQDYMTIEREALAAVPPYRHYQDPLTLYAYREA